MDIRCGNKKHGELIGEVLEIKCSSRFCGAGNGVVVIHRWAISSGECLSDKRYRDPVSPAARQQEGARL